MEKSKLEDRLKSIMHEKAEVEAAHQLLKEQLITVKQAKDQDDLEYKR